MAVSDRIAVMNLGEIQQIGTPQAIYQRPANLFVASFIGLPPMNFFDVEIKGDKAVNPYFTMALTDAEQKMLSAYQGKTVVLGVRPENIATGGDVDVTVFSNENLGMNTLVHGRMVDGKNQLPITCKLRGWCDYKAGDHIQVQFEKRHFFDKETTNAIR